MTATTLYRIVDTHPYLSREDEYTGLTLEEAASRMDDLTGVGADVILADFDEDCTACAGLGTTRVCIEPGGPGSPHGFYGKWENGTCDSCGGTGKRRESWEWVDEESGREVTMRLEVE